MGCASSGVDQVQNSPRSTGKTIRSKIAQALLDQEFASFGDEIRLELDPVGPLERLLAEAVIQSAWRLKVAIERNAGQPAESKPTGSRSNPRSTAIEHAARSVRESFDALQSLRNLRGSSAISLEVENQAEPEIAPNEWPIVPSSDSDGEELDDEGEISHYRDRLMFDFEVSDVSPVVKGTWVTVGHIVSLIVDGWTWADILRSHPELTEDDIRACVSYAMDEENACR